MHSTNKTVYLQSTIYADVADIAHNRFYCPHNYPLYLINAAKVIIEEFGETNLALLVLSRLSPELRQLIFDVFPEDFIKMSLARDQELL